MGSEHLHNAMQSMTFCLLLDFKYQITDKKK